MIREIYIAKRPSVPCFKERPFYSIHLLSIGFALHFDSKTPPSRLGCRIGYVREVAARSRCELINSRQTIQEVDWARMLAASVCLPSSR